MAGDVTHADVDCDQDRLDRMVKSREEHLAERLHAAGYRLAAMPQPEASLEKIATATSVIENTLRST
jgi:hypothetical protein